MLPRSRHGMPIYEDNIRACCYREPPFFKSGEQAFCRNSCGQASTGGHSVERIQSRWIAAYIVNLNGLLRVIGSTCCF